MGAAPRAGPALRAGSRDTGQGPGWRGGGGESTFFLMTNKPGGSAALNRAVGRVKVAINGYFGRKGASIRGRGRGQPLRAGQGRRSLAGRAAARNAHLFCEFHTRSRLASGCFFPPLKAKGTAGSHRSTVPAAVPSRPAPSPADYNSQRAPLSGASPPLSLCKYNAEPPPITARGRGRLAPSRGAKLPFSVRPSFLPRPPSCAHRVSGRRGAAGLR